MKDLLKWELKQTFGSRAVYLVLAVLIFFSSLLGIFDSKVNETGLSLFITCCNNINIILLFFGGIYSGINISGAFDERKIQAAVMAGNSRFNVVVSKIISFAASLSVIIIVTIIVNCILSFLLKGSWGAEGTFLREVVVRTVVYTLVEVSFLSISFIVCMFVKKTGTSILLNLFLMIILNTAGQIILESGKAYNIIKLTPVGQTFIMLLDVSTVNLITAVIVSLVGLGLTLAISCMKFSKEELK